MSNKNEDIHRLGMGERLVNVGHGNFAIASRIVSIMEAGSLPMKRLREKASEKNALVDATAGRKMRSIVVMNSGHLIISALSPQTLGERFTGSTVHAPSRAELEMEEGEFVS